MTGWRSILATLLMAAASAPALAQVSEKPSGAAGEEETEARVTLDADSVYVLQDEDLVVAEGNVRAEYQGRVMTAERLTYNRTSGSVRAQGNVVVTEPDGTQRFAEEFETDATLANGYAVGFALQTPLGETAAANAAQRRNETYNVLDQVLFTACELCEDGSSPTWAIRAGKAVIDEEEGMFSYRNAVLEIAGVPVVYFPYFAHPDPQADRRSGFLFPRFGMSSKYGVFLQPQYYWSISPYQDVVIAPAFYSKIDPRLALDYRKRFYSGDVRVDMSMTNEARFDDDGDRLNNKAFRGHLFADGRFRINNKWRWGFAVEEVTDDLYIERYDIPGQNEQRGIYRGQPNVLLSQLYTQGQSHNWYVDASAQTFDNLGASGDAEDAIADVLPYINSQYDLDLGSYGFVSLTASSAFLQRVLGVDSRRVSTGAEWSTQRVIPGGVLVEPFANARFDYYDLADFPSRGDNERVSRGLGAAGVKMSMPFYRPGRTVDVLVEPTVMGAVATASPNDENIPVEDGAFYELNTASLFDASAQGGYDLYEGDQKIAAGISTVARWKNGVEISSLVGRRWRSENDETFSEASNLDGTVSDWIATLGLNVPNRFSFSTKIRLDDENLALNGIDTSLNFQFDRARATAMYYMINEEVSRSGIRQEGVMLAGEVSVTDNLFVLGSIRREIQLNLNIAQSLGVGYQDECSRFELVYERQGTLNRELGPSESIVFRFSLKSIGQFGSSEFD